MDTDEEFSLNPYIGCSLGCAYCYVQRCPFAYEHPLAWGRWVQPKVNAPFLLGKAKARVWARNVFMSTATDPYQYVERRYRLSRRCLEVLLECNLRRLTVHTRSHVVLEDLGLLLGFGERLRVGFSIPTDDDRVRKRLEPHAPTIKARIQTMRALHEAGKEVHAAVAPLIYCNPRQFTCLLKGAASAVYIGTMRYAHETNLSCIAGAASYIRSHDHGQMVRELQARLSEVGLSETWQGEPDQHSQR